MSYEQRAHLNFIYILNKLSSFLPLSSGSISLIGNIFANALTVLICEKVNLSEK